MTNAQLTLGLLALSLVLLVHMALYIRWVIATNFIIQRTGEEVMKLQQWRIDLAKEQLAALEGQRAELEGNA